MNRKTHYLILDVETTGGLKSPLIYDLGFMVIDRKGNVYEQGNYIVGDIFLNRPLMKTAYYKEKIPMYNEQILNGTSTIISFNNLRKLLLDITKKYNRIKIGAYNANFDKRSLDNTLQYLNGTNEPFFPINTTYFCIWHMACQVLFTQKTFFKDALSNNWLSPVGNLLTNAETCYKYITKDVDFTEQHTGFEDVKIEKEIFLKCLQQKKKMNWNIKVNCWNIPNSAYKSTL